MSLQEALKRIAEAKAKGSKKLDLLNLELSHIPIELFEMSQLEYLELSNNQLTELSAEIGQFQKLKWLYISSNKLAELPAEIGQLKLLRVLDLSSNRLTVLPAKIGQFQNLKWLYLFCNQLAELPAEIGRLKQLYYLNLSTNQLTELPAEIGQLKQLQGLYLSTNQLTELPAEIGQLQKLECLDLFSNQLAELPAEIGQLQNLQELILSGNPLNIPREVLGKGTKAILAFLREKQVKTIQRYEAKLILLGHGDEGKTCLSRALRGLEFEKQNNTRGINIDPWPFPHPEAPQDQDKKITLWIWDFEGQEINHQSHQFFLTCRSLYIVVFKGRKEIRMDKIEYWLDTIRARALGCKVLLAATECEDRTPAIDLPRLKSRYGDMLPDNCFFAVGCENFRNIPELRERIAQLASGMKEFMPQPWPASYQQAEKAVRERAENKTYISRTELYDLFKNAGVQSDGFETAARIFGDMGIFTHFPDSIDLQDFIVLRPQWLTRAISLAMEDEYLIQHRGEMDLRMLKKLWDQDYPGMYPRFYSCMKEFELCYPLENRSDLALVPLRFSYDKPAINWEDIPNAKERFIEYQFDITPPAGLMSRFIVKTHHLIVKTSALPMGVYWRSGVFLENGEGEYKSQALCTWEEDKRILRIQVKSILPQNMVEQLNFVANAVFSFFEGLHPIRYYGCIKPHEVPCEKVHKERVVAYYLAKNTDILCDEGDHSVNPLDLIFGLHSFAQHEDIREIIRKENAKQTEELINRSGLNILAVSNRLQKIYDQVLKLKSDVAPSPALHMSFQQNIREFLNAIDKEKKHQTPRIFTIIPKERHRFDPNKLFNQEFHLRFYCEHEDPHPSEAHYTFKKPKEWWVKSQPLFSLGLKILGITAAFGSVALPIAMTGDAFKLVKEECSSMRSLADELSKFFMEDDLEPNIHLSQETRESLADYIDSGLHTISGRKYNFIDLDESRTLRACAELDILMKELDPAGSRSYVFGNLRRYRLPDNTYRWLCDKHSEYLRK